MAFIWIIVPCLVLSFFHGAKSQKFVTVKCQKSETVAQYGTNAILECVIQTQSQDTKIDYVSWLLNDTPQLVFENGEYLKKNEGFSFAANNWDDTNMNVSLLITNTGLSHTGSYQCSVGTSTGGGEAEVHLTVKANYSKPKIDSFPEKINPEKDFNLTCEAHGGFPKGDLRWFVGDQPWMVQPEVHVTQRNTGLLDLSTTLTFKPDSPFKTIRCEVYNANGDKAGEETFNIPIQGYFSGEGGPKGVSQLHTQIVAPVVVIGSLIVGLLLVLVLFLRRKRRSDRSEVPPDDDDEAGDALNIA